MNESRACQLAYQQRTVAKTWSNTRTFLNYSANGRGHRRDYYRTVTCLLRGKVSAEPSPTCLTPPAKIPSISLRRVFPLFLGHDYLGFVRVEIARRCNFDFCGFCGRSFVSFFLFLLNRFSGLRSISRARDLPSLDDLFSIIYINDF